MRSRLLKPGFFTNEKLGLLPPVARLLFAGLWCLADREGRLEDRPSRIKAEIFPYDSDIDIDDLLTKLTESGLLHRYETDGIRCIYLPTFPKHQRPHPRESPSVLPCSPELSVSNSNLGSTKAKPRHVLGEAKNAGLGSPRFRVSSVYGESGTALDTDPLTDQHFERLKAHYEDAYQDALTPTRAEKLWELVVEFSLPGTLDAITEAKRCDKTASPNYVRAILERWRTEGKERKGGNHGTSQRLTPEDRARWAIDNWEEGGYPDRAAAERDHGHAIPNFEPAKP